MINIDDDPKEIVKELSETEKNILFILGKTFYLSHLHSPILPYLISPPQKSFSFPHFIQRQCHHFKLLFYFFGAEAKHITSQFLMT